ncbi:MAG: LysR family transcriptional regulator [Lachnospiraceae bacterium]
MLDKRIYTFLELCNVMNYHKTAENLCMTQPAVTQHIKYLEEEYQCELFTYANRKLTKTTKCLELEKYARSIISINTHAAEQLSQTDKIQINIGATKTIGEYLLDDLLLPLLCHEQYEINLIIDNTERLLERLNHFDIDLLLLEGFVDKEKYNHQKISNEEIVGICSHSHPFANRSVSLAEVFHEHVILREKGSGTRAVFETFLVSKGYSVSAFSKKSMISSNKLIEKAIIKHSCISFVYETIPNKNKKIATFHIEDSNLFHEYNFVFLDKSKAKDIIALVLNR